MQQGRSTSSGSLTGYLIHHLDITMLRNIPDYKKKKIITYLRVTGNYKVYKVLILSW